MKLGQNKVDEMLNSHISPVCGRDINWLLRYWVGERGDEPFLFWVPFEGQPNSWTWREFARDVWEIAAGLLDRGMGAGDRVALVMDNRPDFLLFWTAVVAAGGVAICVNPASTSDELNYISEKARPVGAIIDKELAHIVIRSMNLKWNIVSDSRIKGGRTTATHDVAIGVKSSSLPTLGAQAAASIQFTSGTTARPKGVVWTQANLMWAGSQGAAHQGLGPLDRNLVHLPLFHTNGLSYSFLSSLWSGGSLVLQTKFSVSRFWTVAKEYDCTWSSMVSFCVRALRGRGIPTEHKFRGWGHSMVIPPEHTLGGVASMGWFGMTETVTHPIHSSHLHVDEAGTMGRPAAGYDVRIVNDMGEAAAVDEIGELQIRGVRGESLFASYLDDEAATAAAFDGDWFLTGDRVSIGATGAIKFEERTKDVMKIGGENVGAAEIERVILNTPGVKEVAVVGRPDQMLGEIPVAFILAVEGVSVDEIQVVAMCERMLPPFKRPVEYQFVNELPRSTLNKVAKSELKLEALRAKKH